MKTKTHRLALLLATALLTAQAGHAQLYRPAQAGDSLLVPYPRSGSVGNGNIHEFSSTGIDLGTVVVGDGQSGKLAPTGLAVDQSSHFYVAYLNGGIIEKFSPTGTSLGIFASGLAGPTGLAFDSTGNLYVSLQTAKTVEKFSSTGTDLGVFASDGNLFDPNSLAFDVSGNLYVANRAILDGRIVKFSSTGTNLGVFANVTGGPVFPNGLAFDSAGRLYASVRDTGEVQRFSAVGASLGTFASNLGTPGGLAFDSAGDLYVADSDEAPNHTGNGRILEFSPTGASLGTFANTGNDTFPTFGGGAIGFVPEPSSTLLLCGAGLGLLLRRRRTRGVVLALGAALVVSLAPAPLHAETLISSLPGSAGGSSTFLTELNSKGMGFTMPDTSYTLDSAVLFLDVNSVGPIPLVQIWDNSGADVPGTLLITLANPTLSTGFHDFTFTPSSSFTLEADTTYWLVASQANATGFLRWEGSDSITPTGLATHFGETFDNNGTPPTGSSTFMNSYAINGTAVTPEPTTGALLIGGAGFGLLLRRRPDC